MIGMIVTGHGKFAPGAVDALKLLVGEQEYCEAVEFEPSDSVEQLTEKIDAVWQRLTKECDGVVVFTDIPGGTPFNVSIRLKMERYPDSEVISGTNVPILMTAALSHTDADTAKDLANEAVEFIREQSFLFVPPEPGDDDDEVDED